jgi:peptide/nickel transport system permease protein
MLSAITYKSNWWGFIGKRVLIAMVVFLVISFIFFSISEQAIWSFIYIDATPGADWSRMYNEIKKQTGLDKPRILRYTHWLEGFLTGDWGNSWVHRVPIKDLLF